MLGLYLSIVDLLSALIFIIVPPTAIKPTNIVGVTFLVYLCLIFFKVLLDDAAHFADKKKHGQNWQHGIGFTILWNLLILEAIRISVMDFRRAIMYTAFAQLIGLIWIVQNYLHKSTEDKNKDRDRHLGWAYINSFNIFSLLIINTYNESSPKIFVASAFIFLSMITFFDFFWFGTLRRVSETLE
ncbi:MAG: hypothetical protein OEV78_12365 [Spirochaetia bacterium]|nr:hypothetical protein [Spirochaetia bacterium]